jgi:L-iditol 2-dehydrogenase
MKVERAATCGTDLKVYHCGGHARMLRPPTLFGHEFSGVVAKVGPGVRGIEEGQRAACHNSAPCRDCFYCRRGNYSLCENLLFLNGAFAEYIKVPGPIVGQNLLPLPAHVSYEEACLMEPLSCVIHGIDRTRMQPGDTVVVVGDGAIGQMFVWALSMEPVQVIHVGGHAHRGEVSRELGAIRWLNYRETRDVAEAVRGLANGGRGADAVIECTGKPEVWEASVAMLRPGGVANLFGGCPTDARFSVNTEAVHYNEIEIKGIFHSTPKHVSKALELLGRHPGRLQPLLSERRPLSKLHEAFRLMDERKAFKVSIDPGQ